MSDYHPWPCKNRTLSTFASLLREERRRLRWTQAETANYLEVNKKTLENWENDRHPPIAVAQEGALARLYGVATPPKPLPDVGKKAVDKL